MSEEGRRMDGGGTEEGRRRVCEGKEEEGRRRRRELCIDHVFISL